MTDSVRVWDPGFRVLDANGDPVSGAYVEFYDAGTTDAKTVYSDSALSNALGTTVYCDSAGAQVSTSGGSTKVEVYVDDQAFKVIIKDADGNTLETKDNCKGAIDTAPFEAGDVTLPKTPVLAKSSDYTVLTTDRGSLINCNCTSADVAITLPSAVTAGDGWEVTIGHVGSANAVTVATVSSQTMSLPLAGGAATSFQLVSYGERVTLVSDGGNWHPKAHIMGLKLGQGYHAAVYDNGTQTTGTLTCDPEEGNLQKAVNGGAFTLGVPAENCSLVLQVTNNASAGAVTTSSFTKKSGDTITTANGDDFLFYITVVGSFSHLAVTALQ